MTTTASYAERYLSAVARSVPAAARPEILTEVEASIAEQVEPRIAQGEDRDEAERAVVAELGEPTAYAASLIDRPMWLVGPRYYAAWLRLLRLLLWTVPPVATAGVVIGQVVIQASIGEIFGQAIAILLSVIVHVCFWTTLVFFILERTGSTGDTILDWNPDQLPQPAADGVARSELIGSLVMLGIFAGALLWDHFRGFVPGAEPLPVINPDLWPWWIGLLFVLMVAEAALAIAVYARGRWTLALAWVNFAIAVSVMSLGLTALGRGILYNPQFVSQVFTANGVDGAALSVLAALTGIGIAGIGIWDMIDGFLKARTARLS
ncbi:permease prefix domain 1-containing protein [Microbacterium sp. KUDC0406]|uniref:permease prefix domain 1-containing protein n=1 Tax=Microbacterium sp. KUDC0406 TaxID=2909588 RepID=UPI001F466AE1|nr:permease prefix domain 1-containing protein [Microbacterium sp. KUDC0406]UJP08968.1 permease prefix domain 1-containing protein [Microbacterium sp. KUDC0406]